MGWFEDNPPITTPERAAGMTNWGTPLANPGVPPSLIAGGYQRSGGSMSPDEAMQWIQNRPTPDMTTQSGAQDPRAYFQSLFPGSTLTPQQLAAKEAELQAAGIRLLGPNAAGMRTKIELPNGQIVDVIGGAGAGHNRSQWLVDSGGGKAPLSALGAGIRAGVQGLSSAVGGQSREAAHAGSPGYQFIMKEALGALDRSAASRGTILTGGHLKDLQDRAAGLASTDFGNEWNRTFSLAGLGMNAAMGQNQYGSMYGSQLTDLTTGSGNARANAAAAGGQAWGNYLGNMGNTAGQLGVYQWMKPPAATTPPYYGGSPGW